MEAWRAASPKWRTCPITASASSTASTPAAISLFPLTIVYAVASVASGIVQWHGPRQEVRGGVRIYATVFTMALLIGAAYLTYGGIIRLRK